MVDWIKSLGLSHKRILDDWKTGIVSFCNRGTIPVVIFLLLLAV